MLNELNNEQRIAAEHENGPLLILAGAGSGKTKTITIRTANLISKGIPGRSILTLTFTNKAATEMKERGLKILESYNEPYSTPEFTTFHSWCLKFIKAHTAYIEEIGSDFTIIDDNGVKAVIKKIMKDLEMEVKFKDIKDSNITSLFTIIQNNLIPYNDEEETFEQINSLYLNKKTRGFFIRNNVELTKEIEILTKVFIIYKRILRANNVIDFDDLINLSVKILKENKEVKDYIREKYQYIMVDEFQDTNYAQIELLDLIINDKNNICVVGDDSQSIYGWRGADISYILSFQDRFENTKIVNLTKNYRSTESIVNKANKLLESAEEKHSLKESLVAFRKDKGKISITKYKGEQRRNNKGELIFVPAEIIENEGTIKKIKELIDDGVKPSEIAILYRTNAIYKGLETILISEGIPYQIYRGRSIMEKKVVQELISLIQFIINPKNSIELERYLSSTAKILTPKKIEELKDESKESIANLLNKGLYKNYKLTSKISEKLDSFMKFINEIREDIEEKSMEEITNKILQEAFLYEEYKNIAATSKSETSVKQAENAMIDFEWFLVLMNRYENLKLFFEEVILASETEINDDQKIKLMTVHSSKGLEFSHVFLVRFNNGVFPSQRSIQELNLEEERRLAYVAITRAKNNLYISYVDYAFGKPVKKSMFIDEAKLNEFERIKKY